MFEEDHFNLNSVKETIQKVMLKQDHICMVINDPCHNPTGYSLTKEEWKELIAFLNEVSKTHSVVLLNDIAYIDYSYQLSTSRDYMETFNDISNNVMIVVEFSCSKALTSYGLRCGGAVILAQKKEAVREAEIFMEKKARATWSNIPNAAMSNFVWIVTEGKDAYMKEKQKYIDAYRDAFHKALMAEHIYTVAVNKGIRVAVCSLPVAKVYGLAKKMKEIERSLN